MIHELPAKRSSKLSIIRSSQIAPLKKLLKKSFTLYLPLDLVHGSIDVAVIIQNIDIVLIFVKIHEFITHVLNIHFNY